MCRKWVLCMSRAFKSHFSERIIAFIQHKNAFGFPYDNNELLLQRFDRLCYDCFPNEKFLTKELFLAWAVRNDNENGSSLNRRLTPIRQFAKYLNSIGEPAFILPTKFIQKGHKPTPYIYTEEEVAKVWKVLDEFKPLSGYPVKHLVLPAIFRLIYCCGLRPIEARILKTSDVDLNIGKIHIRESKGYKDRIVMLADDTLKYFNEYHEQVSRFLPGHEWFFPKSNDSYYSRIWLSNEFRKIRENLGLVQYGSNLPRIYDFRHTFATHRLYKWLHEGKNLTAMLPHLSAYMGHYQLSDTYYYIHLVPGQFEMMSGLDFSKYEKLLPEVEIDE